MSVSTSLTSSNQMYPGTSSESQWSQDSIPQTDSQYLMSEQYNINPVCNGSSAIYNNLKITNVNNCINSQMSFNPPNYTGTYNPNGLRGQDIRFQNTHTINNSGAMIHAPRNGHFIPNVSSTWASPVRRDRMVPRPTWQTPKSQSVTNGGVKKTKRIRTAFTSQQMMELENEYARARYLDRSRRIELSEVLKLNERTIKIWFQNRRMKEKKDKSEDTEEIEATSTTEFSPEFAGPVIMYDAYPNNAMFERNIYVEQYPVVTNIPQHNSVPSFVENVENPAINTYPTFVLDNNMHLSEYEMQCRQMNMPMENYSISPKQDVKQEVEESSTSENSINGVTQNGQDAENWDLSWIRSIHIDEDA